MSNPRRNSAIRNTGNAIAQGRANAVNDYESVETKKALSNQLKEMETKLADEERIIAMYQQEREKFNYLWVVAKKELEEQKAAFLNKQREMKDLDENHFMTQELYKQKIKHLRFQNQDQKSDLKLEIEQTLKKNEDDHRFKERELKGDIRSLSVKLKEQELGHYDYIYAMNFDFDQKSTELRQEYERISNDVKKKYDLKMSKMRQEMEEQRATIIKQIEEKKDAKIAKLTKDHSRKYADIKNYYSEITATNLDSIKTLKGEIKDLQKKEDQDKKLLQQIEKEIKDKRDPLRALEEQIIFLTAQLEEYEKLKQEKDQIKIIIETLETSFRKLEYEYEVKLQKFTYLEREKNQLKEQFRSGIFSIQQKNGLENLILEKKLENVNEELEAKDLQLVEALSKLNIDPTSRGVFTKKLDEVEAEKEELIRELQNQLHAIRKAHAHMIKAYEAKLTEFVIPVEELGFDPLMPANIE